MKKKYTQPSLKAIEIDNEDLFMQTSEPIVLGDPNTDPDAPKPDGSGNIYVGSRNYNVFDNEW